MQKRYYDDSFNEMRNALERIRSRGCYFLVAGRVDDEGAYHRAADLDVPDGYADLFKAIPGDQFRIDISSTSLRSEVGSNSTK